MYKFLFACAAGLLFGCSRNPDADTQVAGRSLAVSSLECGWNAYGLSDKGLVEFIDPVSRATETNFEAMDEIGVFVYVGMPTYLGSGPYHTSNLRYYTVEGTPDGTTSPQWTATAPLGGAFDYGNNYAAVAYYPYQAGLKDATVVAHAVAVDQSPAKALERSDFLWEAPVAVATATSSPTAAFAFSHLMCKLVLSLDVPTLIDGATATKLNSIRIKNLNTQCTIDLGTGNITNLSNAVDIIPRLTSGNQSAGNTSTWEAIVVPQSLASGKALVEVKVQTSAGEKTINYAPPAGELALGSGQKITYLLTNPTSVAFVSELINAQYSAAYTNQPLGIKVAKGAAWTLTSSASAWFTVSKTIGGTYGASISGTGTGFAENIYVDWTQNTSGAVRTVVLTLTATGKGSTTYTVAQPYYIASNASTVFPATITMSAAAYQLPAITVGNGNWFIRSDKHPAGVRFSRFNKAYSALAASDTVAVFGPTTSGTRDGALISGNYVNYGGQLWIVVQPGSKPTFTMTCGGKSVTVNASAI